MNERPVFCKPSLQKFICISTHSDHSFILMVLKYFGIFIFTGTTLFLLFFFLLKVTIWKWIIWRMLSVNEHSILQSAHQEESATNESRAWFIFLSNLSYHFIWKHHPSVQSWDSMKSILWVKSYLQMIVSFYLSLKWQAWKFLNVVVLWFWLSVFHIITSCSALGIKELMLQFHGLLIFPGTWFSKEKNYTRQRTLHCSVSASFSERKIKTVCRLQDTLFSLSAHPS